MPLVITSTNEQRVKVTAAPTTAAGHPTALDGPLRVTLVSGDATVTQDPAEPDAFFVVSGDNPGDSTFLIEGDSDLGSGVTLIQDTVTYSVTGALATSFGLSASPAENK
jgi:hypothetical protein